MIDTLTIRVQGHAGYDHAGYAALFLLQILYVYMYFKNYLKADISLEAESIYEFNLCTYMSSCLFIHLYIYTCI